MIKICEMCKAPFSTTSNKRKFCSSSCSSIYYWKNREYKSANACEICIHKKYKYSPSLHAKVLTCDLVRCNHERR